MSSFIRDKGRVNTRRRPFLLLSSLSTHVFLYIPSPPHSASFLLPRRVQITEDERLNQQFPSVDPPDSGNPSLAAPNKALCKQSSTIFQRRVSKLLSRPEINLVGGSRSVQVGLWRRLITSLRQQKERRFVTPMVLR